MPPDVDAVSRETVSNLGGEQSRKGIATLIIPLSLCSTRSAARTNGLQTPRFETVSGLEWERLEDRSRARVRVRKGREMRVYIDVPSADEYRSVAHCQISKPSISSAGVFSVSNRQPSLIACSSVVTSKFSPWTIRPALVK
jgi:hypothetical protein